MAIPDPTEGIDWPSNNITWSFATSNVAGQSAQFSSFISSDAYQSLVEKAVELWSSVADINMQEVPDSSSADIRIGFQSFDPKTSNEIGETNYSYDPETKTFDPGVQIGLEDPARIALSSLPDGDYSYGNYDSRLFQVIVHELGHALGLAHNTDDLAAVMNPTATSLNQSIDTNDALGIEGIYGGSYTQAANLTISDGSQDNYIYSPNVAGNSLSGISIQDGKGLFETVNITETVGVSLSDPTENSESNFIGGVFRESGDNLTADDYAQTILRRLVFTPNGTGKEAYLTINVTNSLSGSSTIDGLIIGPTNINAMYETILGRAGDTGGLQSAVLYLDNGASADNLRSLLANSAEAQTDITNFYEDVLGRAPDPGALPACSEALINGTSLAQLRTDLVDSSETQADITDIYQDVLGRAPDAGAAPACTQALLNGESLAQLRTGIADSSEAQTDISNLYENILGHAPDPYPLSQYSQNLADGASLSQLRAQIANSVDAQNAISNLYQDVLGRGPNSGAIAACSYALQSGESFDQLRASFAYSPEAKAEIANLYEDVLGRTPGSGELTGSTQALASGTSIFSLRTTLAYSPEAQTDLTSIFENSEGRLPDAAELGGFEAELVSPGNTLSMARTLLPDNYAALDFAKPLVPPGDTTIYSFYGEPTEFDFSTVNFGHDIIEEGLASYNNTTDGFNSSNDAILFAQNMVSNFTTLENDFSSVDGGTLITLDDTHSVELLGVQPSSLTSKNFRFVG